MDTKTELRVSTATNANTYIASMLDVAQDATAALARSGIRVFAALVPEQRRPTLMVDRLPDGVERVIKQRYPNGQGGTTIVEAAPHLGCQLEWMHDVFTDEQAARIRTTLNGATSEAQHG